MSDVKGKLTVEFKSTGHIDCTFEGAITYTDIARLRPSLIEQFHTKYIYVLRDAELQNLNVKKKEIEQKNVEEKLKAEQLKAEHTAKISAELAKEKKKQLELIESNKIETKKENVKLEAGRRKIIKRAAVLGDVKLAWLENSKVTEELVK